MITYHITTSNPAALQNIDIICKTHPFVKIDDGNYRGCVDVADAVDAASLESYYLDVMPEIIEYSC
jgi:hypothetical protein